MTTQEMIKICEEKRESFRLLSPEEKELWVKSVYDAIQYQENVLNISQPK
jgi:hypothetical protein